MSGKGKATIPRKSKEEIVILTQKCSLCGKTEKEIKKKWREQKII
jgi:hypothetical protein